MSLEIILTSSVIVSLISIIGNIVMYKLNRNDSLIDKNNSLESKVSDLNDVVESISIDSEKYLSSTEEIKSLQFFLTKIIIIDMIKKAMHDSKISYEEKGTILNLYNYYHKLGGNGQLSSYIDDLNSLTVIY